MAQNDMLKRYLDAGIAFTQMTRARAEEIVKDLVTAGEVQRDQMQSQVDDIIERSRRNTDQLLALIRQEVSTQFAQLGLATKDDLEAFGRRLADRFGVGQWGRPTATAKKTTAAKKAPATKKARATKKAGAVKKAPATKKAAAAKKTTARKAPAKKTTGPAPTSGS